MRAGARSSGSDGFDDRRVLDLGPAHPATHGTVAFRIGLDGDTITDLDVQIGYLHRGFEKECESRTWHQAIPYTDRLNYNSAILCNVGYCLAVEKLLGVSAPERAQWLRALASELSRVGDHLTRCSTAFLELQAMAPFLSAIEARELCWDLQEALCGARVTSNYVRIGGVRHDLPEDFAARFSERIDRIRGLLRELDAGVTRNRIVVDRLRDSGALSREDCLRYAVTGPMLRAAGVPLDLRKDEPYLVYDQLDFDVPIGTAGDNLDRYLVCFEEMTQSLNMAEQCVARLARLGPAPIGTAPLEGGPDALRVPAGEAYCAIESANGELGFYLVSDGGERPVKLRCRPPSLLNLQPLPLMLRGGRLADLVPTFDFLNMVGGECDR